MLLPISWLKDIIDLSGISDNIIEEKLFSCGFEVEEKSQFSPVISGVVVGKIESIKNHQNSDHLKVCYLNCGEYRNSIQIVTGASNVKTGDLVPVALDKAKVYDKNGTPTIIKKSILRGVESNGMLCSGEELGINDDWYEGTSTDGILILDSVATIGQDIREFLCLNEEIWDVSITANMPHCQSVYGIARELSAHLERQVIMPELTYKTDIEKLDNFNVSVLASDLCPCYIAHCIRNVIIEKSPVWMRRRLILAGYKPVNNIVDITNYVLAEIGQPMHAFDLSQVKGQEIIVRCANNKEKITTLDGTKLDLNNQNLLICDKDRPIALAGIMGGLNSKIQETTNSVMFESALFSKGNIRKTSRLLGISSDSSYRFEKGVDKYTTSTGIKRALNLIQKLNCGVITSTHFDIQANPNKGNKPIKTTFDKINSLLGIKIPNDIIIKILKNMGYEISINGEEISAIAPAYREDVEDFPDLAEDIIKVYGYENIKPFLLPNTTVTAGGLTEDQKSKNKIKKCLVVQGCHEVINYSFYSKNELNMLKLKGDSAELNAIKLLNPISEKYSIMRTILAPSIINILSKNMKDGNHEGRFFELANVFKINESCDPEESLHLSIGVYGNNESFFTLKGIVEAIGKEFDIKFDYKKAQFTFLHPYISAEIFVNNQSVGFIGQVSYECAEDCEFLHNAFIGELNYEVIKNYFKQIKKYEPLPVYHDVSRDLALTVNKDISCGEIEKVIKKSCDCIREIKLFDIYNGGQIDKDKKSMTFTIKFKAKNEPLNGNIINDYIEKILDQLNKSLGVNIRSADMSKLV